MNGAGGVAMMGPGGMMGPGMNGQMAGPMNGPMISPGMPRPQMGYRTPPNMAMMAPGLFEEIIL